MTDVVAVSSLPAPAPTATSLAAAPVPAPVAAQPDGVDAHEAGDPGASDDEVVFVEGPAAHLSLKELSVEERMAVYDVLLAQDVAFVEDPATDGHFVGMLAVPDADASETGSDAGAGADAAASQGADDAASDIQPEAGAATLDPVASDADTPNHALLAGQAQTETHTEIVRADATAIGRSLAAEATSSSRRKAPGSPSTPGRLDGLMHPALLDVEKTSVSPFGLKVTPMARVVSSASSIALRQASMASLSTSVASATTEAGAEPEGSPGADKESKRRGLRTNSDYEQMISFISRRYASFFDRLRSRHELTARKHVLGWLAKHIDELYDARAAFEAHQRSLVEDILAEAVSLRDRNPTVEAMSFDRFVLMHLAKKNGLRSLTEQTALDLVYNVELERASSLYVELFALFLEGTYDVQDLEFFLFARAVFAAELRPDKHTHLRNVVISPVHACELAKVVLGAPLLASAFFDVVDAFADGAGVAADTSDAVLAVGHVLALLVVFFHSTRPDEALLAYRASTSMADMASPDDGQVVSRPMTSSLNIISDGLIAAMRTAAEAHVDAFFTSIPHAFLQAASDPEELRTTLEVQLNSRLASQLSDLVHSADLAKGGMSSARASGLPREVFRYHEHLRALSNELQALEAAAPENSAEVADARRDFAVQLLLAPDIQAYCESTFNAALNGLVGGSEPGSPSALGIMPSDASVNWEQALDSQSSGVWH
ncbi:uncharacterized protein AMSG_03291 [Thecamonas trahens ATCC 50062]|uniref:Uncharacterized protein n=1 Tax=Thecamonas trahens ATCC 50062 TaxID=461836 RepID=A0A0L0D3P7_THETB|nr:hypothetical protein AMSG_03291 [Thecamonas trahens ATCC 50062]KNC46860.1 hypothetical protein AMSG_03291 [Thecamonas trahens ATCC 50062]|eukprot:XP_013760133.1 hypothetical protein AMSG_03291 [Thecamonas trahens ATCC 50062]